MKTNTVADIEIPMTPNFIRTVDGVPIPVQNFPDDELSRIGEAWTEKMIMNARQKRGTTND